MNKFFYFIAVSLLLAACNNSKNSSVSNDSPKSGSITDTYWKLVELNGRAVPDSVNNRGEIYLVLFTTDKRAAGNAGCNRYSGRYELNNNGFNLRFLTLMHTEMACADLEIENEYLKVLDMTDSYYANDSSLQLNKGKMAPLARFAAIKGKPLK
jgi:heat shock protein HslJ